nr:uncharacterized protein LOC127310280 [Lolium perenne]
MATEAGLLSPVAGSISCSLYADDVSGEVSGLVVNLTKSQAIPIRCDDINITTILQPVGLQVSTLPCTYLGMPLSLRRLRKIDIQPLIDKIAARLGHWKGRLMSRAGRLTLLRAVLSALPVFIMTAHPLSAWAIAQIDKLRRAWLWAARDTCTPGQCRVAWKLVSSADQEIWAALGCLICSASITRCGYGGCGKRRRRSNLGRGCWNNHPRLTWPYSPP